MQILQQATSRLQLTQAARRLFTSDGTLVLHLDDLIDWAKEPEGKHGEQRTREKKRNKTDDENEDDNSKYEEEKEIGR